MRTISFAAASIFIASSAMAQNSVTSIYSWSATIYNGDMEMVGFVPTPELQRFLAVRSGVMKEDNTSIEQNAPTEFLTNSIAAVTALKKFESGRAAFTGANWSLAGVVETESARSAVLNELSALSDYDEWQISIRVVAETAAVEIAEPDAAASGVAVSEGSENVEMAINEMLVEFTELDASNIFTQDLNESVQASASAEQIASQEIAEVEEAAQQSVVSADYSWTAKIADSGIEFSGQVPSSGMSRFLEVRAGEVASNDLVVADGAPESFVNDAVAATTILNSMRTGTAKFANGRWSVVGTVDTIPVLRSVRSGAGAGVDVSEWSFLVEVALANLTAEKSSDGSIALAGLIPNQATTSYLSVLAGENVRVDVDTGGLVTQDFIPSAVAGVRALNILETGVLNFDGANWSLSGQTLSDVQQGGIRDSIAALPAGDTWTLGLEQAPLAELCADAVTNFSDTHTILFAPASANLRQESQSALVDLVRELNKCPTQALYVEGHTDSDGPSDSNMALSVARSEAVIDELVQLGISYTRLYAVGYGETLPIDTNDTRQGKERNRRIVFALETP